MGAAIRGSFYSEIFIYRPVFLHISDFNGFVKAYIMKVQFLIEQSNICHIITFFVLGCNLFFLTCA